MAKSIADLPKDLAEEIQTRIRMEIDRLDINFTGQLRDSWKVKEEEDGTYTVYSDLVYARAVDEGRLPGSMPPVSALFPWVATKLGGVDPGKIRQVAFAVAKKIEREGIAPQHYVRSALFMMESESS